MRTRFFAHLTRRRRRCRRGLGRRVGPAQIMRVQGWDALARRFGLLPRATRSVSGACAEACRRARGWAGPCRNGALTHGWVESSAPLTCTLIPHQTKAAPPVPLPCTFPTHSPPTTHHPPTHPPTQVRVLYEPPVELGATTSSPDALESLGFKGDLEVEIKNTQRCEQQGARRAGGMASFCI
jgi:hypothetical protein